MAEEKEYVKVITGDDYEEDEDADVEFNPNESDSDSNNELEESSSEEEETESMLEGSIHISHNEGKLVYNGTWHFESNTNKKQKFRLKSKQNLKDCFSICNPLFVNDKMKSKRTIWMDGFFWVTEGDSEDSTRKVKERDLELTFLEEANENKDNKSTESKENGEIRLSVQGRGCNEFGSFTLNGTYKVRPEDKSNNTLICKKSYIDTKQRQRSYSIDDNKHSTLQSRFRYEQEEDIDDDDCIVDEEADFDELIALNEEANMSVEELRKRYMGGENGEAQDSNQPNKKQKTDVHESDEDGYGF